MVRSITQLGALEQNSIHGINPNLSMPSTRNSVVHSGMGEVTLWHAKLPCPAHGEAAVEWLKRRL